MQTNLDSESVEHWKSFLCSPSQALIHYADGYVSLVLDVSGRKVS